MTTGLGRWPDHPKFIKECRKCGETFACGDQRRIWCSRVCSGGKRLNRDGETHPVSHPRLVLVCQQCKGPFKKRKDSIGIYCSNECKFAAQRVYLCVEEADLAERWRERERKGLPIFGQEERECLHCSLPFIPGRDNGKYCSQECAAIAAIPINREHSRQRGVRRKQAKVIPPRDCRECGTSFVPDRYGDRRRVFCSTDCQTKSLKRIHRKKDKARRKGATVESVDPLVVFARDRWRCQLCGIRTPKRLKGSYAAKAPELDHIIPLSQGGEHSYRNTQCACRDCNMRKAASALGQLRLFG
jgi:5-methylcytosine-specific restriction endonuclease McrA